MKLAFGMVVLLLILAVVLAVPLVAHRQAPVSDCASRIVTVKRNDGRLIECVCLDGALSTCFDPGP